VDDDLLTRKLMSRMLTRLGCTVDTAENGKIALEKILGVGFDSPAKAEGGMAPAASVSFERPLPENQTQAPTYDVVFLDNQMVRSI
jgi:CheY-like chemotaxis protein